MVFFVRNDAAVAKFILVYGDQPIYSFDMQYNRLSYDSALSYQYYGRSRRVI